MHMCNTLYKSIPNDNKTCYDENLINKSIIFKLKTIIFQEDIKVKNCVIQKFHSINLDIYGNFHSDDKMEDFRLIMHTIYSLYLPTKECSFENVYAKFTKHFLNS